tara:strand:- start:42 stop:248 length:207 start_codon:yes stop_codon:yes gene_type:complete
VAEVELLFIVLILHQVEQVDQVVVEQELLVLQVVQLVLLDQLTQVEEVVQDKQEVVLLQVVVALVVQA